jgi:hypothetical protein
METSIFSKGGREIPMFNKSVDYFLNRSVILYGASNSGKSTIIKDILYTLRKHIPNVCVICPTNKLNGSYDNLIPKPLIHSEVKECLLNDILKRQSLNVKIYNLVNNLDKLESLYSKLQDKNYEQLKLIKKAYQNVKEKSESSGVDRSIISKLDKEHNKKIIKFYKETITNNIKYITSLDMDENDKMLMKHMYINPNFLIIIDDAAVTANTWCKFEAVKELFFNGRHHKVTFMIAFQDDKLLDSSLRKNAFINIFTTEKVCNTYFTRTANNFSSVEKKHMADIAEAVFRPISKMNKSDSAKKEKANYKKLVYLREEDPPCKWMQARIVGDLYLVLII